ncbi:MAG: hypothetical protein J4G04_03105 [Nitrosopumilaceae archaeon]|nr:hypothetical protein [Nitrosopumilaceae archaeon]
MALGVNNFLDSTYRQAYILNPFANFRRAVHVGATYCHMLSIDAVLRRWQDRDTHITSKSGLDNKRG